jgi:hypothetical protein
VRVQPGLPAAAVPTAGRPCGGRCVGRLYVLLA